MNPNIKFLIDSIQDTPKFTRAEEQRLIRRKNKGDQEARDLLIRSCMPWVIAIAKRQAERHCKTNELDELISEGFLGLVKAVDKIKSRKAKLVTYSKYWILASVLRYIGAEHIIRIPHGLAWKKVNPTYLRNANTAAKYYKQAQKIRRNGVMSLSGMMEEHKSQYEDDDHKLYRLLPKELLINDNGLDALAEKDEHDTRLEKINNFLDNYPNQEAAKAFRLRYYKEMPLKEIMKQTEYKAHQTMSVHIKIIEQELQQLFGGSKNV
jgi:RNA polymerase sigma factor (sigma-70 family)